MIKAVIFDLDDTIYDYQACNMIAMDKLRKFCIKKFMISAEEFDCKYDEAREIVKGRLKKTGASHNRLLYIQTFLELLLEKPAIDALELYDVYWDSMLENMKLYDYVLPLFEELARREVKIAILTDLTAHIQHRKVKRLGLSKYIDVFVTSEESGREKPDQKIFTLVKEKLNLPSHQILCIGDSYERDIKGAQKAGMHHFWFQKDDKEATFCKCMQIVKYEDK